jgi:uncharacterized membrane protein YgdD (TMEM256/DUF423 family)
MNTRNWRFEGSMKTAKILLIMGAVNAFLAVTFGAFGAHALKARLSADMQAVYQTAVQYHFYHALGLLLIGVVALNIPSAESTKWAGRLMILGIVLFSGSLYVLSITGVRWLGAITPLGGLSFLIAWALLALGVLRMRSAHAADAG